MLVAPASRRRWWCTAAGWFYRPRDRGAAKGAAMLVAPASRRRWWCTAAGWFYRPRDVGAPKGTAMLVAPASRRRWCVSLRVGFIAHGYGYGPFPGRCRCSGTCPHHRPSGPPGRIGVPVTQRRTIGVVARGLIERAATTPMARRRPASWPGQQTSSRSPGEPGMGLMRNGTRRREVLLAQSHARHPDGARFSACPEVVGWLVGCRGLRLGTDWVIASTEGRDPGFWGF